LKFTPPQFVRDDVCVTSPTQFASAMQNILQRKETFIVSGVAGERITSISQIDAVCRAYRV
jgi:hypothetical protein